MILVCDSDIQLKFMHFKPCLAPEQSAGLNLWNAGCVRELRAKDEHKPALVFVQDLELRGIELGLLINSAAQLEN